jgi:HEAT repeat protein
VHERYGVLVAALLTVLLAASGAMAASGNHPIRSFSFKERGETVAKLYRLGLENDPRHIPVFCEALKSDDVEVRTAALAQLVFTHDESAVEPVTAVMRDRSTTVRRYAIACLEKIGSPNAIPALKEALTFVPPPPPAGRRRREGEEAASGLSRYEYFNQLAAVMALARLGNRDGADTVLTILKEPHDKAVLQMAIRAVLTMDLKEATPALIAIAQQCESFGEDSPGFHALRALRIMGDPVYGPDIVRLAQEKFDTPGGFVKLEALHLLLTFGDANVAPVFTEWARSPEIWPEHQALVAEGLRKLAPPDAAAVLVRDVLARTQVDEDTGQVSNWTQSRVFQLAAMAVADLGDKSVVGELRKVYDTYRTPIDYFPLRLYVAYAMAKLGDSFGLSELEAALAHEDAGVRRMSAKLLGVSGVREAAGSLTRAIKRENDGPAFGAMKTSLGELGALSAELKALPVPPEPEVPVDTYGKPRYVFFTFDDCNTIEAMERFIGLMEELAQQDVRWVFTMFLAPNARDDFEYLTLLVQRGFDRGCEIENHSLHHNPEGQALGARTEDAVRLDLGGGQNWLHGHIMGLDKIYRWKSGGGGFRRPGDPTLDRQVLEKVRQEAYWAKDITYGWVGMEEFRADLYAPPYHDPSSALRSDWSGGDLQLQYNADTVEEGRNAYVSSFDDWYFHHPDRVFVISGHDFPKSPVLIRVGHEKDWDIFSGFIREVLLSRSERYPQLYCMTALELTHITRRGVSPADILNRTTHLQDSEDF